MKLVVFFRLIQLNIFPLERIERKKTLLITYMYHLIIKYSHRLRNAQGLIVFLVNTYRCLKFPSSDRPVFSHHLRNTVPVSALQLSGIHVSVGIVLSNIPTI